MEKHWKTNENRQILPAKKWAFFVNKQKITTKLKNMIKFQYNKMATEQYIKNKHVFIVWQKWQQSIGKALKEPYQKPQYTKKQWR